MMASLHDLAAEEECRGLLEVEDVVAAEWEEGQATKSLPSRQRAASFRHTSLLVALAGTIGFVVLLGRGGFFPSGLQPQLISEKAEAAEQQPLREEAMRPMRLADVSTKPSKPLEEKTLEEDVKAMLTIADSKLHEAKEDLAEAKDLQNAARAVAERSHLRSKVAIDLMIPHRAVLVPAKGQELCGEILCPEGDTCCNGVCGVARSSCCNGNLLCEPGGTCCNGICCGPQAVCCNGICGAPNSFCDGTVVLSPPEDDGEA